VCIYTILPFALHSHPILGLFFFWFVFLEFTGTLFYLTTVADHTPPSCVIYKTLRTIEWFETCVCKTKGKFPSASLNMLSRTK
jgi:hypothetical protein